MINVKDIVTRRRGQVVRRLAVMSDSDDDDESEEDDDETQPTEEEKMDMLVTAGAELEEANEQLAETLRTVYASLGALEDSLTNLQDEVFGR